MNADSRSASLVSAFAISGLSAIVLVVVLTVGGELYSPLKDWLKEMFGHHWVGKGVLAAALFVALGGMLSASRLTNEELPRRLLSILLWGTILSVAALSGFYIFEAFFLHG